MVLIISKALIPEDESLYISQQAFFSLVNHVCEVKTNGYRREEINGRYESR